MVVITFNSTDTSPYFFQCADTACLNETTLMYESQYPAPASYFFSDEIDQYIVTSTQDGAAWTNGVIPGVASSAAAQLAANGGSAGAKISVHGGANTVGEWYVTGYSGNNLTIDTNGWPTSNVLQAISLFVPTNGDVMQRFTGSISGTNLSVTAMNATQLIRPGAANTLSDYPLTNVTVGTKLTAQQGATGAVLNASIASNVLTVNSVTSGTLDFTHNTEISGSGITAHTVTVTGQIDATNYNLGGASGLTLTSRTITQPAGGLGAYTVNTSQTVASEAMVAADLVWQYALQNVAYSINAPGQFAYTSQGCQTSCTAIAWLPNGSKPVLVSGGQPNQTVTVSGSPRPIAPRNAVNVVSIYSGHKPSYISINNLRMQNYSAYFPNSGSGFGVNDSFVNAGRGTGVTVNNVDFNAFALFSRNGALHLYKDDAVTLTGNRFNNILRGTGVWLQDSAAQTITGNEVDTVGKTGFDIYAPINDAQTTSGVISGNVISGANGSHGNALSIYPGSGGADANLEISNNTIGGAYRPLVFRGSLATGGNNNIAVHNNIFQNINTGDLPVEVAGPYAGVTFQSNLIVLSATNGTTNFPFSIQGDASANFLQNSGYRGNPAAGCPGVNNGAATASSTGIVSNRSLCAGLPTVGTWVITGNTNAYPIPAAISALDLTLSPGHALVALPPADCTIMQGAQSTPFQVGAAHYCP